MISVKQGDTNPLAGRELIVIAVIVFALLCYFAPLAAFYVFVFVTGCSWLGFIGWWIYSTIKRDAKKGK